MTEACYSIREEKNLLIPMPDGIELAANLILPLDAPPAPAIVVYQPYLKDLHGRGPILEWQRHFARRGYPALTVDIRGTGMSGGGTMSPPNALSEKEDAVAMLAWIATQEWCNGVTGMWGISYSGSTSLAAASMNPPSLKAIIPLHGTKNEYWGFLRPHGCRPAWWTDASWGPFMVLLSLLPPLARDDGQRWARIWRERLETLQPVPFSWHTTPRDTYMSWATDASAVDAALYAVSGWHDYYPQATFDYFNAAQGPKRILIGTWKHEFPDLAERGGIDHLTEMDRWWDRWLRGIDNGIDQEPPVHVWHQGVESWRSEQEWPPATSSTMTLLADAQGALTDDSAGESGCVQKLVDPTIGLDLLPWDPQAPVTPMPFDRSGDDHRAICFDSRPFAKSVDLIGQPRAIIQLESDVARFPLHVALTDVHPNGLSTLICQGWLDTRFGLEPPLAAGKRREVVVPLYSTSYRLAAGHRLRLVISGADFPLLWPAPNNPTLSIHTGSEGGTRIELPVANLDAETAVVYFREPTDRSEMSGDAARWENVVSRDLTGTTAAFQQDHRETLLLDDGTLLTFIQHNRSMTMRDHPEDTAITGRMEARLERDGGPINVVVESVQTLDRYYFEATIELAGRRYFHRTWEIPANQD